MYVRHKAVVCTAALLLASLNSGCSQNEPSTDDVAALLAQRFPNYAIEDLECESFADRQHEGAGRTSCQGMAVLAQELYAPYPPGLLEQSLVEAGIPAEGATYFVRRHPAQIYSIRARAGEQTPLSADCSYLRAVDAWNIGCNARVNGFEGSPRWNLSSEAIIVDSPEHRDYLRRVLDDYRQLDAEYRRLKSEIDKFFAPGRTISLYTGTQTPVVRARMTSPVTWTGERGFLGYPGELRILTPYEDRRSDNDTFCGYEKGTPPEMLFVVGIWESSRLDRERGAGPFKPRLSVFERTQLFNNELKGCMSLDWNNGAFGDRIVARSS